jgi:hypothetical protein
VPVNTPKTCTNEIFVNIFVKKAADVVNDVTNIDDAACFNVLAMISVNASSLDNNLLISSGSLNKGNL